ncbi:hypothetical protein FZC79_18745 [Rossellomorea vietnamensis]|uniref:Uncharacterized protein n=1 Tax=Rossellomorea vietnamensis TaxID=218284 RepID=A0A5D4K9T9_9BACI|nr:hypothetical protein [Rossellomorea vietnamensis]TYR73480.1 hypothetical protein FZC79_18745 [Rossellomorea vietnamensis]
MNKAKFILHVIFCGLIIVGCSESNVDEAVTATSNSNGDETNTKSSISSEESTSSSSDISESDEVAVSYADSNSSSKGSNEQENDIEKTESKPSPSTVEVKPVEDLQEPAKEMEEVQGDADEPSEIVVEEETSEVEEDPYNLYLEDWSILGKWETEDGETLEFLDNGYVEVSGIPDLHSGFYEVGDEYVTINPDETDLVLNFYYSRMSGVLDLMEVNTRWARTFVKIN